MRPHRLSPALAACAFLLACAEVTPPPQVAPPKPATTAAAPETQARHCAFQGVVRTEGGTGVKGALVAAIPPGAGDPAGVVRSDGQGRYCFETLAAGSYGFTITAPGHTAAYVDVREVQPAAPGAPAPETSRLDVQVGGPGFVLRGRAADDKGVPAAGTYLFVPRLTDLPADLFVTETDADGRYEVKLPAAMYQPFLRSGQAMTGGAVHLDQDRTLDITIKRTNPKDKPAPDDVVAWIRSKAIPLKTALAGKGLEDMEPLKAIVGDARLVALGEATHGTREFFQLKHRMLEFLVEKMGFRAFGIEASFGDCLPLTEYVRTGKGDPKAALANQGFWTWDTEEVLALVQWMRRYNEDKGHPEKLSFWGFDMQSPAGSTLALLAYLQKVDPAFTKEIGPALEPIDDDFSWKSQRHGRARDETLGRVSEAVRKIDHRLASQQKEYIQKTTERDLRLARIHVRVLTDFLLSQHQDYSVRDRSMADVAADLLHIEGPRSKMVLWAHNGHINESSNAGMPSMGSHLARRFGDGYVTFGFAFDEGSFQAIDFGSERRGLIPFTVPSAPPGSLDHTLARANVPLFALSLRGAPGGPVSDWLSAASYTRSFGAVFDERVPDFGVSHQIPGEHYDALLFVQKTTAARPNETGKRKGDEKAPPPPSKLPDPGFEGGNPGEAPAGWNVQSQPKQLVYRAAVSDARCASGKRCAAVTRDKADVPTGAGTLVTSVDATPYRGKRVKIVASMRVEGKGPGDEAFLMGYPVSSTPRPGESLRMVAAQAPGSSWSKVEIEIGVSPSTERLVLGAAVTGAAKAWIDDVEVIVPPADTQGGIQPAAD